MESKFWILIILALPVVLFATDAFIISPMIYSEGGALYPYFMDYIVEPSLAMGLTFSEIWTYVAGYIFDFYIILFAVILIVLTDVRFADFGFDFSSIKWDVIIGVLFFIVDIILLFSVMFLVSNYVPKAISEFSLSGSGETAEGSIEIQDTAKPTLTPRLVILNFILFFFFVGPAEEIFRLFTFIKLEKVSGGLIAFFLSALIFGAMHLYGSGFQSINAFIGGLAYNALWLLRGKKIFAPIIAHGFYDFMLFLWPFIF
jgi:membrane protease YdiL (CAAX protease family)